MHALSPDVPLVVPAQAIVNHESIIAHESQPLRLA